MNSQHETLRRPPMPTRLSVETSASWVSRRIKGRSFVHILSSPPAPPRLLFSPLSSPSIVDLGCCRWLPWHAGHIDGSIYCSHRCSIPTVHFAASPLRVDPPVIQPVAHHAGPCFHKQVSHITAETIVVLLGKETWRV